MHPESQRRLASIVAPSGKGDPAAVAPASRFALEGVVRPAGPLPDPADVTVRIDEVAIPRPDTAAGAV